MNKIKKKTIAYIILLIGGAVILGLGTAGIADSFYSGMGGGIIGISIIRLVQLVRFSKDKKYAKKVEIEVSDERNIYISNKAKSMTFNWGILACAAATVVLRIIGMNDQSTICGLTICIVLVLYWVIYLIYNKNS